MFFHGFHLCEEAVEDSVTTVIIHIKKGLEPWVKSCAFVEEVLASTCRVSFPQVLSNSSLDVTVALSSSFGSISLSI